MNTRLITTKNGKSERILKEGVCPIIDICGKCELLDLSYKEQLYRKSQIAKEDVHSLGADFANVSVKDCAPAPEKLAYRNYVHLVISEHTTGTSGFEKRRIDIGFVNQISKRVIDIGRCPIQNTALNHILAWLRTGIRLHHVSVKTPKKKDGLLCGVILHATKTSKHVFVYFIVSKLTSAQLRPLACDIASKFSNVRGIFMRLESDTENKNLKLLAGYPDVNEIFMGRKLRQKHPNLSAVEKLINRINDLKKNYQSESFLVLTTNDLVDEVLQSSALEDILTKKPKIICFVGSFSNKSKKILKTLRDNHYTALFVEPFDVLPGTNYFENIVFLERINE